MRRIAALLTAFITMLAMTVGCSIKSDERHNGINTGGQKPIGASSIMDVLGDDMLAIYENRDTALPVAIIYTFQGEGGRIDSPLYGEAAVNEALDAIAQITIVGETDITVTDNDSCYSFINADGSEAGSVSFNGGNLEAGGKKYEVDNKKALAAIDFPAETMRDTLALDGPDPLLAEFLEKCESEKPAAIKVVVDGIVHEITDADTISECISVLYSIGLTSAWAGVQESEASLVATFVMEDGTEYSLTFYDGSIYIYEFPQPLGVWSYFADGAEYFIEALGVTAE